MKFANNLVINRFILLLISHFAGIVECTLVPGCQHSGSSARRDNIENLISYGQSTRF